MTKKKTLEIEEEELKAIEDLGRAAVRVINELNREDVLYGEDPEDGNRG